MFGEVVKRKAARKWVRYVDSWKNRKAQIARGIGAVDQTVTVGAPPRKAMGRVVHGKDLRPEEGPAGDRSMSPPTWGSERELHLG